MILKTYLKTKDYCKVKFTVAPQDAETVSIHGLNNDWANGVEMKKKKDGSFWVELPLAKDSKHEFKYLIDNINWDIEPEADAVAHNEFGGENSVLVL